MASPRPRDWAVSRGDVAIFFRKRKPPFEPAIHWVFAEDIDASYQELKSLGANIVDPLEKIWGITAVHRKGSGREPLLFPPCINKRRIQSNNRSPEDWSQSKISSI